MLIGFAHQRNGSILLLMEVGYVLAQDVPGLRVQTPIPALVDGALSIRSPVPGRLEIGDGLVEALGYEMCHERRGFAVPLPQLEHERCQFIETQLQAAFNRFLHGFPLVGFEITATFTVTAGKNL